jgi:hypothetical protein
MSTEISILKSIVKPLLWLTKFFNDKQAIVVCRGYGDDWDYYTGLYWDEDKDNDFGEYNDFKLWLNF